MMDLSGYVKQPCIRLEPNGSEPAEVYCKKYAAVYQEISTKLNGGKPIGSYIHDRSGMDLLYAGLAEDGQVHFSGHEIESQKRLNPRTNQYERGLAHARSFSVLEKIANEAGFVVKIEIAQSFMEQRFCYQPQHEEENSVLGVKGYFSGLAGFTSQNQVPTAMARPTTIALILATPAAALEVKPGRTSDTLEMPKPVNPEDRQIGYGNNIRPPDTLVAAKQGSILQGFQSSPGLPN